jgi:hypothetical protein
VAIAPPFYRIAIVSSKASLHATSSDTTVAVDQFMAELTHPCKAEIQAIRECLLHAAPEIAEGIKWKAPSFRTREYFATMHLREKQGVGVILHLGAKVRDIGRDGLAIEDPAHLLEWLAADRARVRFTDLGDFRAKEAAFASLIRRWIEFV